MSLTGCLDCGVLDIRRGARGLCCRCYGRRFKQERRKDPAFRAKELETNRKWYARNRTKALNDRKEYCKENPETIKNATLSTIYNISIQTFNEMLTKQDNKCASCGKPESARKVGKTEGIRHLCIDHNHQTGAIRALLCSRCNMALGLLGDSSETILKLADYIRRFEAK